MNDPYADLGVERTASKASIKRAYRKRAQKAHPDKGGSTEEFQHIAAAFALLSNDAARERFDTTGQTGPDTSNDNLLQELAQLFLSVVDRAVCVESTDILAQMRAVLDRTLSELQQQVAQTLELVKRRERAASRVKVVSGERNLLSEIATHEALAARQMLGRVEEKVDRVKNLIKFLSHYSYAFEPTPPHQSIWASPNTFRFHTGGLV